MNLNMWQRGIKEAISNHDKNRGVKMSTMVNSAETTGAELKDTGFCLLLPLNLFSFQKVLSACTEMLSAE